MLNFEPEERGRKHSNIPKECWNVGVGILGVRSSLDLVSYKRRFRRRFGVRTISSPRSALFLIVLCNASDKRLCDAPP